MTYRNTSREPWSGFDALVVECPLEGEQYRDSIGDPGQLRSWG